MEAGLESNVGKSAPAEDDDAWLYGGHGTFCMREAVFVV